MKRVFLTLLFLLVAAQAEPAIRYVVPGTCTNGITTYNPTGGGGAGSCTGGSDTVYSSINNAMATAGSNTTFIRAGTYDETLLLGVIPGGTIGAPTIISGYLAENPIMRPTTSGSDGPPVWPSNPDIVLTNLTIDAINQPVDRACIQISGIRNWIIGVTCLNAPRDGITIKHQDSVVRNSIVRDCGRIQPAGSGPGGFDPNTKGAGIHLLGDWNNGGSNALIEGNLFEGCRGGGVWAQQHVDMRNVIIRNNVMRNFGIYSTWPLPHPDFPTSSGAINIGHGQNFKVYNNIVYRGRAVASVADGTCFFFWGGPSNHQIYNNTCYDVDVGSSGGTNGNITFKNNILSLVNSGFTHTGTDNVTTNNLINPTVSATFVSAAGGDFSQLTGSASKDAGTSTIVAGSITLTCAGNCDIGAYEMPKLSSCSATGNTLSLMFDNPRFPPLSNLSITGQTGTIDGSSRTLSAPVIVGSNQINITFSGAAVGSTATSAGTSSPITDSALLGNLAAMIQRVDNWTTMTCNVVGSPGETLTQVAFRFHDLPGTEAAPKCLSASGSCTGMENVNASIQQNGCFRARIKIACTGADCLPFAPVIRDSRAAAAYVAIPNAYGAENVKYYGTSDTSPDIPNHLSVVASELLTSGHASNISSAFLRSDVGVPNLDLSQNSEAEIEFTACFDRDEPVGTTHDFRVYKGDGAVLNAYTVTPRATVVAPGLSGGISALGPWDVEIRLGSNMVTGNTRRRKGDGSKFVYLDVPKSALIKVLK